MKNFKVGLCFSRPFEGIAPLDHIGIKQPVYLRLLELCGKEGWETYVLTKKTYMGDGVFAGAWLFNKGGFERINGPVKIDVVYDRSGGIKFPPGDDTSFKVVNVRDFKILCWDKLKTYKEIGRYMPKSVWVGRFDNYKKILRQIGTARIVLKPYNGLKGDGIYIGPKEKIAGFIPNPKKKYIAQEFIDTSGGIAGITPGLHDLRVVVVNREAVWCHVRVPQGDSLLANAALGGNLCEVDYNKVPSSIKRTVDAVSSDFSDRFDNPIYSLDFGMENGKPYIFEINDQIGFPKWEMKQRDAFLKGLVLNFKQKLYAKQN
ncbi:MAG: ATP-grasp domain-containing protein [bacterium]